MAAEPNKVTVTSNGGSRPVPDPTLLTTQLVDRGIEGLRELIESKLEGQQKEVAARLGGMDKAIELLQKTADRIPADIDKNVGNLRTLHEEKFRSVATQFEERDIRTEQAREAAKTALDTTSRDSKLAIDAALQAAEKAVGKSELSTIKQIDAQGQLIATSTKALETILNGLSARLDRIEGAGLGGKESKTNFAANFGMVIGAIGLLMAVASLLYAGLKP